MKPSIFPFFPSFLILFFFLTIHNHVTTARNLILNTCKTISQDDPNINFNFCSTSLQASPSSKFANLNGLGMITIKLIRYNVTDTRFWIKHLMNSTNKFDHLVEQYVKDCFELYSDAIFTIKEAMKSYNSKEYVDGNVKISAVMNAATTCEDGFNEREGVVSPLTKRNNDTFQLSAMALSIMDMLQSH